MSMLPPIVVLSFNRPQFLEPMLVSLKAQHGAGIDGREIHLFQDGAINRYSRIRYANDADIAASIEVFRRYVPNGTIHHSVENVGICENYRRAEHYIFEDRQFELALFLEDDLVLSPAYFAMMERLCAWATATPNVAYVAAYGDYYRSPRGAAARRHELRTLDHLWAFGLLRRHWRAMQPLLEPYYNVVCGTDYGRRDHRKIFALYAAGDTAPRASSQDAAKAFVCDRLGLWRANTVVPFAKYIGTVGQHMTPEAFAEIGYDRIVVAQEATELNFPEPAAIRQLLAEQHALFLAIRSEEFQKLVAGLPARQYNPLRLCQYEDVVFGYRLFLGREPESQRVIQAATGRTTVLQFVSGLADSAEYRKAALEQHTRICSRDDVLYAYRLCLHRDPESEQLFADHVGITDARVLTRAIWEAPEREQLWASVVLPDPMH
jgi:hypothetical protein